MVKNPSHATVPLRPNPIYCKCRDADMTHTSEKSQLWRKRMRKRAKGCDEGQVFESNLVKCFEVSLSNVMSVTDKKEYHALQQVPEVVLKSAILSLSPACRSADPAI
jgi:hypothetical protein